MLRTEQINGFFDEKGLESYWAIVKTGRLTDAAALLDVTQPAVSAAVKKLENKLDKALFERGGNKKLELTEEGRKLFLFADRYFSTQHKNVFRKENLIATSLTVGISNLLPSKSIVDVIKKIKRLNEAYSNAKKVDWVIKDTHDVVDGYFEDTYQIIIVPLVEYDFGMCFGKDTINQINVSTSFNLFSDQDHSVDIPQKAYISKSKFSLVCLLPKPISEIVVYEDLFELAGKITPDDFILLSGDEADKCLDLGIDIGNPTGQSFSLDYGYFCKDGAKELSEVFIM